MRREAVSRNEALAGLRMEPRWQRESLGEARCPEQVAEGPSSLGRRAWCILESRTIQGGRWRW